MFFCCRPGSLFDFHPDSGIVHRCIFHILIKALCLLVICHQGNQQARALLPAFRSQRLQQRLSHFMVSLVFQNADPIQICAEAGGVAPAADQRSVDPADHLPVFQRKQGYGRTEPGVVKALFQPFFIRLIRLPVIRVRLLSSQLFYLKTLGQQLAIHALLLRFFRSSQSTTPPASAQRKNSPGISPGAVCVLLVSG